MKYATICIREQYFYGLLLDLYILPALGPDNTSSPLSLPPVFF